MSRPDIVMYPLVPIREDTTEHVAIPPRTAEPRNGLPQPKPYAHRQGEAARDAEVAALVAEAKRRAEAKAAREDEELRRLRAAADN
jgi:hypothetical protein